MSHLGPGLRRGLSTFCSLEGPAGPPFFFLKYKEKKRRKWGKKGEEKEKKEAKGPLQDPMGLQGAPRKSKII